MRRADERWRVGPTIELVRESAAPRVPDRQWTTADAPVAEQFALYQQAIDDAFVPVTVRRRGLGAFVSEVSVWRLGGVEVSDIAAPPQSARRSGADVARSTDDVFFLNLPLDDGAEARQHGRLAQLRPGDFVVLDGNQPFDLHFGASFRQISLKIPAELLRARLDAVPEMTALRVQARTGIGSVASAAIRAAATSAAYLDSRTAAALGEHLTDLVALALGAAQPRRSGTPSELLLAAAHAEIDRRLADPDLSPAVVAHRIGVSTRYLHQVFAEHGPSFGRWVQARRLDRARRLLADPDSASLSIGEVAAAAGFADASYFARVFGRQHGLSPRRFRTIQHDPGTGTQ